MLLANCDVQELVTEQINDYLTTTELTFAHLKAQILSKTPLSPVHAKIVTVLTQHKNTDQTQVKKF